MSSIIEICNRALGNIGNSRSINSLNEQSKEAGACSLYYESCRDAVLADADWNFAVKRVTLADTGSAPSDWKYAYAYPTDCLRIIDIMLPGVRNPSADMRVQYSVGANDTGTGKLIYSDLAAAEMKYVARITEVNMYDSIFTEALSWRLAASINMQLTGNADLAKYCMQMYSSIIASALAHSMNESQEPVQPESEMTVARLS